MMPRFVAVETIKEAMKEIFELYEIDESVMDAVFIRVDEKKEQYRENIKKIFGKEKNDCNC